MGKVISLDAVRIERAVNEFLELYKAGEKIKAGKVILNSPAYMQEVIKEKIRKVLKGIK